MNRRTFLWGTFAAPAIVRASSLMAVVPVPAPDVAAPAEEEADLRFRAALAEFRERWQREVSELLAARLARHRGAMHRGRG